MIVGHFQFGMFCDSVKRFASFSFLFFSFFFFFFFLSVVVDV